MQIFFTGLYWFLWLSHVVFTLFCIIYYLHLFCDVRCCLVFWPPSCNKPRFSSDKHKRRPSGTVKDVTFAGVGRRGEWQICADCGTPTWTRWYRRERWRRDSRPWCSTHWTGTRVARTRSRQHIPACRRHTWNTTDLLHMIQQNTYVNTRCVFAL